ncbi:unannotated protein [freshwater metagenome]|uniref:Unannotated protein n=1 Tax=freshwater metagenome TaxID=449393 RepID=A0A6J7RUB2_9ZZZZ
MGHHLCLAGVQLGVVADPLLALKDLFKVAALRLRPKRDVAGAVVVERLGVCLPHLDAGCHQLGHRRLVVVVANDAAGDAGCARPDAALVDDENLFTALSERAGG